MKVKSPLSCSFCSVTRQPVGSADPPRPDPTRPRDPCLHCRCSFVASKKLRREGVKNGKGAGEIKISEFEGDQMAASGWGNYWTFSVSTWNVSGSSCFEFRLDPNRSDPIRSDPCADRITFLMQVDFFVFAFFSLSFIVFHCLSLISLFFARSLWDRKQYLNHQADSIL